MEKEHQYIIKFTTIVFAKDVDEAVEKAVDKVKENKCGIKLTREVTE